MSTVVLRDRPTFGKLWFSDETFVTVGALPNDGSALTVTTGSKNTTSVRFEILTAVGLEGQPEIGVR